MGLSGNTFLPSASKVNFIQLALAIFVLLAGMVASASVFLNDVYFWVQSHLYINPYLFLIAFILGVSRKIWGLMGLIFLLPLSAGLGTQLNSYVGTAFLVLPNAGLDLAAGFFLGSLAKSLLDVRRLFGNKSNRLSCKALMRQLSPWPIALVIVMITTSTAIAISRNVYQSAAPTSFKGLLFNLVHFRPIDWHDDYMPISDWIAYALAVATVAVVIGYLRDRDNKKQIIFRPFMAGLMVAVFMGLAQAITGLGLPESLLGFRKDQLGYAVIGFQPDLHAFAGHMLLGAVGLWGYFFSGIAKFEKKIIGFVVAISWVGLILSKSRALLLFALIVMLLWFLSSLLRARQRLMLSVAILSATAIGTFLFLIIHFSDSLSGIPILSWLGDLVNQFKSRDLTSWSQFSGVFGARFEIWEGAIRMWSQFPLMGIGQGNFYRLSDIASFSRSNFLILNHGENAHNYFLQTLTETGVIGGVIFITALVAPFLSIKDKRKSIVASVALLSLFLGNIFSHTFLVRENLLLVSIVYGFLWSSCQNLIDSKTLNDGMSLYPETNAPIFSKALPFFLPLVLIASGVEVYKSFGRHPFDRGYYCYLNHALSNDGWTSGKYLIDIPLGSRKLEAVFEFKNNGLVDSRRPPELAVDLINSQVQLPVIIQKFYDQNSKKLFLKVSLEGNKKIEEKNVKVRITMQHCFTPRNLGLDQDGRRLGAFLDGVSL